MTLCALRAATALSRIVAADFGRPLTKKVMSRSRDVVQASQDKHCISHSGVESPASVTPLKKFPTKEGPHFTSELQ